MKWIVGLFFIAVVYAQSFGPEYDSVVNINEEMGQITKEIKDTMRGIPNYPSAEFTCLQNLLIAVGEVSYSLHLYKFSVAMWHSQTDVDKRVVSGLLTVETNDIKGTVQSNREFINKTLGANSQFASTCVAKGTELLRAMKKADDVLTAILNKLKI
jgi:hypothetical protein